MLKLALIILAILVVAMLLLTVLCQAKDRERMVELLFRLTSTLGIRESLCRRYILRREKGYVETPYGPVGIKQARGYGVERAKPEYEDLKALAEAGIEVCAGAEGDTDEVIEAYLRGELESAGVTCDHHGEGHSCGEHEDGHSCGGGGCHGGCGAHSALEGRNVGKTVRAHYRGTFNDGEQFDSSYDRGEPLEFVCGAGMMIKGFDAAVADMEVGQVVDVHLMPEEAYGQPNPEAIFSAVIAEVPGAENLSVGQQVYLTSDYGQPIPVKVAAKDDTTITFDANHEMAGKELNFRIELVEVL